MSNDPTQATLPQVQPTVTNTTVKMKIKRHPNDVRYPGGSTHQHMDAQGEVLARLSQDEVDSFMQTEEGEYVFDQEKLSAFVSSVRLGDVVGVHATPLEVTLVDTESNTIRGIDKSNSRRTIVEFLPGDISMALEMGFCEILYRDGKPFGLPEYKDVNVRITDYTVPATATSEEEGSQ